MSMFHELMMRNKEEIMYATIKGSLTESPEGVFSGFSASNYLQIDNALPTTIGNKYVFEGETEITATSTSGRYIFSFFCNRKSATSVFGLLYRSSGCFAVAETNGTQEFVHQGTIAYQINTKYKYKVETDLNTYIRVYINDVLDISVSLSYNNISAYDGTMYYGIYANENNLPLTNGSINLNNTSVKINSTKYKLQAVVGYTVVGSPTITDGVVSGFSRANYLSLPNFAPTEKWEVFTKIKTGTTMTDPVRYFFGCMGIGNVVAGTTTGNKFKIFISTNNGSSYNVTLTTTANSSPNTTYYIKFGFNGIKYYVEQYDINKVLLNRKEIEDSNKISSYPVNFGRVYNDGNSWNGSIDMNETYIKINNKLWFNGQQA